MRVSIPIETWLLISSILCIVGFVILILLDRSSGWVVALSMLSLVFFSSAILTDFIRTVNNDTQYKELCIREGVQAGIPKRSIKFCKYYFSVGVKYYRK